MTAIFAGSSESPLYNIRQKYVNRKKSKPTDIFSLLYSRNSIHRESLSFSPCKRQGDSAFKHFYTATREKRPRIPARVTRYSVISRNYGRAVYSPLILPRKPHNN